MEYWEREQGSIYQGHGQAPARKRKNECGIGRWWKTHRNWESETSQGEL